MRSGYTESSRRALKSPLSAGFRFPRSRSAGSCANHASITVIIGARNEQQLRDNIAAASWALTDAEVENLDNVSALPPPYPYWHQQKFAGDRNPPPKHVR
jgi:aryl-alcohol dehydrogenase-like predicted oxidoreductase